MTQGLAKRIFKDEITSMRHIFGGISGKLLSMKLFKAPFCLENAKGNLSYFLFKMFLYCGSFLSYSMLCLVTLVVSLYQILQIYLKINS